MMTDCHSHILPEMDDGSDSIEMSCSMLEQLRQQGVERSIATPHFYRRREKSVAAYLEKRQRQFAKLKAANPAVQNIFLGAEVAIEKGLSGDSGYRLDFAGTALCPVSGVDGRGNRQYRHNIPSDTCDCPCPSVSELVQQGTDSTFVAARCSFANQYRSISKLFSKADRQGGHQA